MTYIPQHAGLGRQAGPEASPEAMSFAEPAGTHHAPRPRRGPLSMPDLEEGSRIDWIKFKLGTGPEPGTDEYLARHGLASS
jgi:hypothetical protein